MFRRVKKMIICFSSPVVSFLTKSQTIFSSTLNVKEFIFFTPSRINFFPSPIVLFRIGPQKKKVRKHVSISFVVEKIAQFYL